MHKKALFILAVVSLLTFGNSLFNGFLGDDHMVIVDNAFYTSWRNFPLLFAPAYVTQPDEVFNASKLMHTGSVAYRPVLSTTFFVDYGLWRRNPFGYHLHNLLLHAANSVLVYFIVFFIVSHPPTALLSAILFSVHPLKSEAVCAIGYRADALASLFLLSAFLSYIRLPASRGFKKVCLSVFSHVFFFLAVFSKESAIGFVALLIAYEGLIRGQKGREVLRHGIGKNIGYVVITLFYVFVYVYVFQNSTLRNISPLGGSWLAHIAMMFYIFSQYLTGFLIPFQVRALPPLFTPALEPYGIYKLAWAVVVFMVFIWLLGRSWRRHKVTAFFLLWFLITYIPVSNLIPLVNPMAYRFMYLPSVGLLTALSLGLQRLGERIRGLLPHIEGGRILKSAGIMFCMIMAISLNTMWKDDFVMASHMVKDFPDSPMGYLHLGMVYFVKGDVHRAQETLEQGLRKGLDDPRGYYHMGLCLLNDFERAKPYFEKSIRTFPYFALSYVGLGRIYILEGSYEEAIPYLQRAVELRPSYPAYGYLVQGYTRLGRLQDAHRVFEEAQRALTHQRYIDSLQRLVEERDQFKKPEDLGIE